MLFCYQDLIRLVSFNTVCLRDPTQMSPESGAGTPLKKTASHRAPFFFFSFLGGDASEFSSARCVAPGIEDGVALRAISSGLVDSALGEDHVLVRCPLPLAASELSLRKPTHAAKAAPVVCAANRFPVRRFFPFHRFAFSPFHRFLPRR